MTEPLPQESAETAATNPVHDRLRKLSAAFDRAEGDGLALAATVQPSARRALDNALKAVAWNGSPRDLADALPHFSDVSGIRAIRAVLARLHIATKAVDVEPGDLSRDHLPCLFSPDGDVVHVVASMTDEGHLSVLDSTTGSRTTWPQAKVTGTVWPLRLLDPAEERQKIAQTGWLSPVVGRFRPLIVNVLAISFLVNLSALALPLFTMHVYDLGIGTGSMNVVMMLALGAGIVIATDLMLRLVRGRAIAWFGARLDALIGMASFQHLLHLPIGMTENAPVSSQVTRLRQFESIRESFTGTLATAIVDVPFILVFLIAIAAIGGQIVWVPVTLLVVYAVLATITLPITRRQVARVGEVKTRLQSMVIEMLSRRATLRDLGVEDVWLDRHDRLLADYQRRNLTAATFNSFVQTLAQALVTLSGILTIGLAAWWVIQAQMTPGALIAIMALVWRVLAPLQQTFLSISRLEQAVQSFRQIDRLMKIKPEREAGQTPSVARSFKGRLVFNRVYLRYPQKTEAALRQVLLDVAPGELVAITGPSGSGKSTLLKMAAGLYPPQGGAITIDGLDLRQLDPADWRSTIGYVPDQPTFFYGTVAQNMTLGFPTASVEAIREAVRDAGLEDFAHLMPDGLETRLTGAVIADLPDAFRQRLMLARAWVRRAPVYLLDNPGQNLDRAGDEALVRKLASLKGSATVLFTTYRPSHMRLADRLVVLEQGQVAAEGAPDAVLAKMSAA